ncbi:MAG TPA: ComEC/Rec2 family competence protein [Ginsengibacter sp.]
MATSYKIFIWKKAPFLRLLLPVIVGIIAGYYLKVNINIIFVTAIVLIGAYFLFSLLPLVYRYKLQAIHGIIITAFIINAGLFLTWNKDVTNHSDWYGKRYDSGSYIVATISEPPVEKNKSYKVVATVNAIIRKDSVYAVTGKLLLYFSKDSASNLIAYGKKILIKKELQEIKNSGNPAAFNYKRYCAFQQIFHQCYLKANDWVLFKGSNVNIFRQAIFTTQQYVVNVLNKYIQGPDESAVAKALLIGYKADLDKDLVQAYSNAGVVHLIAISGLHLGLIYVLLFWITGKIPFVKRSKIIRLMLLLSGLWIFSFLTGASASVLRSAVMFTFIAVGMATNKKSSIYNSMAASAFVLLCINPFMLWDVGFQLSYCAVAGIVIAQKFISNWFYFNNKIIRSVWQLASVSLAAQLFTLPLCVYYFHQVPLLFLVSNLIAIPIATITLWGCLALVFVSSIPLVAVYTGKLISCFIWLLNHSILFINSLPFSLWDGISFSVTDTVLLYLTIIFFLYWLIKQNKQVLKFALLLTCLFTCIKAFNNWHFSNQKKIIVYDVPSHKAIDFIDGHTYHFIGDSDLVIDGVLQNFHLKPARISYLLHTRVDSNFSIFQKNNFFHFCDKKILTIDSAVTYSVLPGKINVDYIIISKNPKIFIPKLAEAFNCSLYIFDASNPMWKIEKWKKDCEELHLRFHSVPEQGAFITDL